MNFYLSMWMINAISLVFIILVSISILTVTEAILRSSKARKARQREDLKDFIETVAGNYFYQKIRESENKIDYTVEKRLSSVAKEWGESAGKIMNELIKKHEVSHAKNKGEY